MKTKKIKDPSVKEKKKKEIEAESQLKSTRDLSQMTEHEKVRDG